MVTINISTFLYTRLASSTLLDKSCSSIVEQSRIKPVKNNNGSVIISDEEGFNNLTEKQRFKFGLRLSKSAIHFVDTYACWGQIDYQYFSSFPELKPKLQILGNPRSDLLIHLGRSIYSNEIQGLNAVFGDYVLASDNFRVEPRNPNIKRTFHNITQEEKVALNQFSLDLHTSRVRRRKFFSKLLEDAARSLPTTQFILRPHPSADTTWWYQRFSKLRNIHVVYLKNVEPWILASSCLMSMGCTTAIQAAVAHVPVVGFKIMTKI